MKTSTMHSLQFIQAAGIPGLVGAVKHIMTPAQVRTAFYAVEAAITKYQEAVPQDRALTDLRTQIRADVHGKERILALLTAHQGDVELAVRMAIKINTVGQVAITSGATVANLKAPYDLGAEWCWIPPGLFYMGSRDDDEYAYDNEKSLGPVMTGGYFMLDHPVTNAEFQAFLKATGREDARDLAKRFAGDDQPAVKVTQQEATAYSEWLGREVSKQTGRGLIGRLPTEAEWEKAAKGPFGKEFIVPATSARAHFDAETTRSVNHPDAYANSYGLKDMIGNVWEWTSTPWEDSSNFALRGASWDLNNPHYRRAAYRYRNDPDDRDYNIGFRPLLAPQDS